MTTPVFTQAIDAELSKVSIQIVLPLDKETKRYASHVLQVPQCEELFFYETHILAVQQCCLLNEMVQYECILVYSSYAQLQV